MSQRVPKENDENTLTRLLPVLTVVSAGATS